jgi:GntR family transcriptional regulator, transcriptional repressor for pyruvate dehydrogenase complex
VTSELDADPAAVDYLQQVRREDRLADKVADSLEKAILSGQLKPADRLPPERVLGDRFGVSRTVIREAIRSLTAKGLVEVRSGSGTVVASVGADAVVETMRLYLRGADIQYAAIDELRAALEEHAAWAAAERATEDDLRGLREAVTAMAAAPDHERCARHGAEFHRGVARAAGNPLHLLLLDAIAGPVAAARRRMLGLPGRQAEAIRAHERILDRIAVADADGAREAMRAHLAEARRAWESLPTLPVARPPAEPEPEPAI